MKAAKLNQRPAFALMKQTDIQSVHHLQMPRWLFSDQRYAEMSLDAKVAYTFLLNRFQLSRRKVTTLDLRMISGKSLLALQSKPSLQLALTQLSALSNSS